MGRRRLACVLGGGGARGALQAGALKALHDAGYRPDLFVGTSIGAINAVMLGLQGFTPTGLAALETAWQEATTADLLPPTHLWLIVRAFLGRNDSRPRDEICNFLARHGVTPDLAFGDLTGAPVLVVATDLRNGELAIYGDDPTENVLQATLASAAIPPWIRPVAMGGRLLLDGGSICNLPIEPALNAGVTEIIALDLNDGRTLQHLNGFGEMVYEVVHAAHRRQAALETALAEARHVSVRTLRLCCPDEPVSVWDFKHSRKLMADGYALASAAIEGWASSLDE